jgi:hypothetical protein
MRTLAIAATGFVLATSCAAFASEGRGRDTAPGLNRDRLPETANKNPGRGEDDEGADLGRTVVLGGLQISDQESFLRFSNLGDRAGMAEVTLLDSKTGDEVATWTSASIAGHAALQVSAKDILGGVVVKNDVSFTAIVRGTFNGQVQHVGWSTDDHIVSNLTACRKLATPERGLGYITGLGTSALDGTVRIINQGSQARAVTLVLHDAATGAELGTWTSPKIAKYGSLAISSAALAEGASPRAPLATKALTISLDGSAANMSLSYTEGADGAPATDLTAGCPVKGGGADDKDEDRDDEDEDDDEDDDSES